MQYYMVVCNYCCNPFARSQMHFVKGNSKKKEAKNFINQRAKVPIDKKKKKNLKKEPKFLNKARVFRPMPKSIKSIK